MRLSIGAGKLFDIFLSSSLHYISKNLARHFTKFQPWMIIFVNVAQFQRPVFVKRYPERRALGAFFQLTDWIGIS